MITETKHKNKGVFDRILSWASGLENHNYPEGVLNRFIGMVEELERRLQDMDSDHIVKEIKTRLGYWFSLSQDSGKEYNLNKFSLSVSQALNFVADLKSNVKNAVPSLEQLTPQPTKEWLESQPNYDILGALNIKDHSADEYVTQLSSALKTLEITPKSGKIERVPKKLIDYIKQAYRKPRKSNETENEWEIIITFGANNVRATHMAFLIWSFTEALELIDGVTITLEDWGHGSFWAKFKIRFNELWAKKEVRDVLEKTRDAIIADQLDKRIEEVGKMKAEHHKIDAERSAINAERLAGETKEEAIERRRLERRKLQVEIESNALLNQERKLAIAKKVAYMMREGLIIAEPVRIDINNNLYLGCDHGEFQKGLPLPEVEPKIEPSARESGGKQPS